MGLVPKTCLAGLFYPDWEGKDEGCLDNGMEPAYMMRNPYGYLFNTQEDCCREHYSWNYKTCMGIETGSGDKWYPDWEGDNNCKNDGGAPKYMVETASIWLEDSLESCCKYMSLVFLQIMHNVLTELYQPLFEQAPATTLGR
jgi:hypothetical protein